MGQDSYSYHLSKYKFELNLFLKQLQFPLASFRTARSIYSKRSFERINHRETLCSERRLSVRFFQRRRGSSSLNPCSDADSRVTAHESRRAPGVPTAADLPAPAREPPPPHSRTHGHPTGEAASPRRRRVRRRAQSAPPRGGETETGSGNPWGKGITRSRRHA